MTETQDFLLEIGTEELPPKSLNRLAHALTEELLEGLQQAGLTFGDSKTYATPRRLAVYIQDLVAGTPDKMIEKRGPAVKAAFDAQGHPTLATLGFANACQTTVDQLEVQETDKGAWLYYRAEQKGTKTAALLPVIVHQALQQLPISKPMRWGSGHVAFVRPVHWILMLMGNQVVKAEILGMKTGDHTYGHRFHHPDAIKINVPAQYSAILEDQGYVVADFQLRKQRISQQLQQIAVQYQAKVKLDEALLEEVTALVEWPVALGGSFDQAFLQMPPEVIMTAMRSHQKYFALMDNQDQLLPHFIVVSNIESRDPQRVIAGNQRVLRARLADAQFFFYQDLKQPLQSYLDALKTIVFQKKLGTLHEKAVRISALVQFIASSLGHGPAEVQQVGEAGLLAKADLMTTMVGEFPELQGIMGSYYATQQGYDQPFALALREHYHPRFAKDTLPTGWMGCYIAIADKIDTLVGLFGIHQPPSGEKDPFGLRRAALGVLRILIEKQLPMDLLQLLQEAIRLYGDNLENPATSAQTFDFMLERLRAWYLEKGISAEVFAAVLAKVPTQMTDFDRRISAVQHFQTLPPASALAAANKRVSNILKHQEGIWRHDAIDPSLFAHPAEQDLFTALTQKQQGLETLAQQRHYTEVLVALADLQTPIDHFFNEVMVMVEDEKQRNNRLALLHQLQQMFLQVADLGVLGG
ncbi:MAG: glycine--tRNA ligase subunit beta [Gammaproteobacteria bacterium]